MRNTRLVLLALPLFASACVPPPDPAKYSLDQVITETIQGLRKGLADGTAPIKDPNTGKPYPAAGLPICSLTETWAIAESNTKSTTAGFTASGAPVVPIGFSLAASSGSTRSAANTVVIAFNSPLCSPASGGGGGASGGASRGGETGSLPRPTYMFLPKSQACPANLDTIEADGLVDGKVVHGHYCMFGGTTAEHYTPMSRSDYPPSIVTQ